MLINVLKRIIKDIKDFYPAMILFAVYNVMVRRVFHAFCPFLIVTGFPCAGCGMTRAVCCILKGQLERGMSLNPAAPLWIAFLIYFFTERYIIGNTPRICKIILGVVILITFAIYIFRMINFFPGNPPLVFYENNIISNIFRVMPER